MKKAFVILFILLAVLAAAGCAKKTVHCDRCGKEIELPANSKITEDWITYCEECAEEIGPMVEPRD